MLGLLDGDAEPDVAAQVEPVGDELEIGTDLLAARVALGPVHSSRTSRENEYAYARYSESVRTPG